MKRKILGIVLLFVILTPSAILASNITGAYYLTRIGVNNTGTAATNAVANFTLNTTDLMTTGMLNSTATDAVMRDANGNDIPFMPGYNGNAWISFISSLNAYSQTNQYLYTKNATGGLVAYFPGDAGMNVTDNASLEPGVNFTITQTGFIDTTAGANKWLVNKPGAIVTNITSAGNITTTLIYMPVNYDFEINGNWTTLSGTGAQSGVQQHGGAASWLLGVSSVVYQDMPLVPTLKGASLTITGWVYSGAAGKVGIGIDDGVGSTNSSLNTLINTWEQLSVTRTIASNATRIRFLLRSPSGTDGGYFDDVATTTLALSVSATGVASGNHTVTSIMNSDNLSIYLDGVLKQTISLNGSGVPDTADSYQFNTANISPYVYSINVSINGTQQAAWRWEYGATFTDLTGNGHTATPTFRTAGTANINASVVAQSPTSVSQAPTANATTGWTMIGSNPSQPTSMYTASGAGSFPWKNLMDAYATATKNPAAAIYRSVAIWTALLAGMVVFAMTHIMKTGTRGSLLFQAVTTGAVMVYWYTASQGQALPGWVLIPVGAWVILLLLWRNPNTTPT